MHLIHSLIKWFGSVRFFFYVMYYFLYFFNQRLGLIGITLMCSSSRLGLLLILFCYRQVILTLCLMVTLLLVLLNHANRRFSIHSLNRALNLYVI